MNNLQHWRTEKDQDGILWCHLDQKNTSTNTVSSSVLDELETILKSLDDNLPKGVVILSGKSHGFIAGADVKEFTKIDTQDEALQLIQRGQRVYDRLEQLSCPTVALINGFCLGGGLELALACDYRIADDDPKIKLGLPEVKLGIHPGFGGTVRLPRLIGAPNAMDMMLTGRALSSRAAKKIGLVDYAVPTRHLFMAARETVLKPPKKKKLSLLLRLSNHRLVRPWLAKYLRKQVAQKAAQKHYPAPYAIIDLWERYFDQPGKMLTEERNSDARLVTNDTARNLVRVFFLQEQLKTVGDKNLIQPRHVHVVGGGVMGGDIAAWCALQGLTVTIQDRSEETLARVYQRAFKLYQKKLKVPRLIQAALDRLVPDIDGLGIPQADVIIEAIFEDIKAKQELFKDLEAKAKPDALLATNTSSIPLETIGEALQNPSRLVGLHFFNPVAMMQLVEIVQGKNTDAQVAAKAMAFTRHIDKLPVPVTSTPGFLVNRILMPYLLEAVIMESEGISAATIDASALDFGMPMGPIELADTVGLDICLHVAENLAQAYAVEVPQRLKKLVADGKLGQKSGSGFYQYKNGKKVKTSGGSINQEAIDRMVLRFANEAVACHREKVVTGIEMLDAGIIFGTGFAPFRGGPMNYIQSQGAGKLQNRMQELTGKYGARFNPDAGWQDLKS